MKKYIKKHWLSICSFLAAFLLLQFIGRLGYSADGDAPQYMGMDGSLPPLYPLFLYGLRVLFGEAHYLMIAVVCQSLLGAAGIVLILSYVQKEYRLHKGIYILFGIMLLAPFVRESMREAPRYMASHLILTEAICIPLFYGYIWAGLKTVKEKNISSFILLNVFSFLLMTARAQFKVCIPMNLCVLLYLLLVQNKKRVTLAVKGLVLIMVAYLATGALEDGYKMARLGTTKDAWNSSYFLLHCMYASDEEDVELYDTEELRTLYTILFQQLDERSYNYQYLDGDIYDKSMHWSYGFSSIYRDLKSSVSEYVTAQGFTDEIEAKEKITEYVDGLMEPLAKKNGIRSFVYSFYQFPVAMCTSVFVLKDQQLWFTYLGSILIYGLTLSLLFIRMRQNPRSYAAWVMIFVLTFMIGNAIVVDYVLHTQARYFLYTMGVYYVALGMICVELFREYRKKIQSKEEM